MFRSDIIEQVLAKLDEITVFDDAQQVPTVALVDKMLNESTINMLRHAPLQFIKPTKINTDSEVLNHQTREDGTGHIGLPDDFIRLYSFKMTPWLRPVSEAITIQHPKYKLQFNKITRGGIAKPVVAVKEMTLVNDGLDYDDPDYATQEDPQIT